MKPSAHDIKSLAADLGFALCGIAPAQPPDHADFFRQWIADRCHGSMAYLARHLDLRLDPTALLPGARSIICLADAIGQAPCPPSTSPIADHGGPPGRIARYAQLTDYHKVIKKRLHRLADILADRHPGHRFRCCVDTAPLAERAHAARAGLGWIGKNTCLLNRRLGSHLLLGEILTTLDLPHDPPATDHCGTCRRCLQACPTACLTPHRLDARRCISYLTIEHRGPIDPDLHPAIGHWLFGCDLCQQVCPFVRHAGPVNPPPAYRPKPDCLSALAVLDWTEHDRRTILAGSPARRATLTMLRRNAAIVLGNTLHHYPHHLPAARRKLQALADDPHTPAPLRQAAGHSLGRLGDA